jgi:hypothetical protein
MLRDKDRVRVERDAQREMGAWLSGFKSRHIPNYKMRDISKVVANKCNGPPKIYKKTNRCASHRQNILIETSCASSRILIDIEEI